jgi:hypothetical protein
MPKCCVRLILWFLLSTSAAWAAEDSGSDSINLSVDDKKIIAVLELLELMDLVQDMDLLKDMQYLIEGDPNEDNE